MGRPQSSQVHPMDDGLGDESSIKGSSTELDVFVEDSQNEELSFPSNGDVQESSK